MASDPIEITVSVDRDEAASMTYGAREKWLGEMAEAQLAETIPPRPPMSGSKRNRWKPYTRNGIAQAFAGWAQLNDGKAPSRRIGPMSAIPKAVGHAPAAIASGRRSSNAPERTTSVFPDERRT
jgi:hypothetical protein